MYPRCDPHVERQRRRVPFLLPHPPSPQPTAFRWRWPRHLPGNVTCNLAACVTELLSTQQVRRLRRGVALTPTSEWDFSGWPVSQPEKRSLAWFPSPCFLCAFLECRVAKKKKRWEKCQTMKEDNLLFVFVLFCLVFTLACLQKKKKKKDPIPFLSLHLGAESHTVGLVLKIYPNKMGRPFTNKLCHRSPLF